MTRHDPLARRALAALLIVALASLACANMNQIGRKDEVPAAQAAAEQGNTSASNAQKTNTLQRADLAPLELRCEQQSDAGACAQFARQALASEDASDPARAAMALYRACELGLADGCYHYGLLVWMGVGMEYNAQEITRALDAARKLNSPHVSQDTSELTRPTEPGQQPSAATIYHYKQACGIGVELACSRAAAFGADVRPPEQTQPDQPQPEQPSSQRF